MNDLFKRLNQSLEVITSGSKKNNFGDWEDRSINELKKFVDLDKNVVIKDKIINFIANIIFVSDSTSNNIRGYYSNSWWFFLFHKLFSLISAARRGGVKAAKIDFNVLRKNNKLDLLNKYPMPVTGNPCMISYKGYKFTNRYIRHIYFFSIFKEHLEQHLPKNLLVLDIGPGYGTFQSLIKKEFPKSKHILVDIPGQLLLAEYYLQIEFPYAKVATIADVNAQDKINQDFIECYDFILIPADQYTKLYTDKIDLVTNFVSFIEMPKYWFDLYTNSTPFKTAEFFYTVNRYDSYPTYSSGITIMDFPFENYEKLFFRSLPILKYYFSSMLFFIAIKKRYPSELFQFIGRRIRL